MSLVSIVKGPESPSFEEIKKMTESALHLIGGLEQIISPGDEVLIKPNLVADRKEATTSPLLVLSLVKLSKEAGARKIFVGDGSAIGFDTQKVFDASGMRIVEKEAELVDLKSERATPVFIPNGIVVKKVKIPETVLRADIIINVPIMKTHDILPVTLGLKNMKGCLLNGDKRRLHRVGLDQGIVDINKLLSPQLTVIDGIVGMEGYGPSFGDPVELDLVIASTDVVAADSVACRIMGFRLQEVRHISLAAQQGLGIADLERIRIVGEPLSKVRRKFKRITLDIEKEGNCKVIERGACTGCKHAAETLIFDLQRAGDLDLLEGYTLVFGSTTRVPSSARPPFLCFGVCVSRYRNLGIYVGGCPPRKDWIIRKLAISQKKKVKARIYDKI
jgi:uncharacterized protein (DUF362 family)